MAFECINVVMGDILDNRNNRTIRNHFLNNYSVTDRRNVETVTIDMNGVYVSVIKELFPQAKIIINRFHLVQLINRSMNNFKLKPIPRSVDKNKTTCPSSNLSCLEDRFIIQIRSAKYSHLRYLTKNLN
ncbi:hypothetical protein DV702_07815 [Sporosarcina sp. PTS2304]|uniref:transposase n=1 Tax=Sporosarcina sp. PTS2304 TaxID=2283194 RepID=UPI000E0D8B5D|nr:hypothetical protein DV702_07815 [Sporosarcina sp. PTS2304]